MKNFITMIAMCVSIVSCCNYSSEHIICEGTVSGIPVCEGPSMISGKMYLTVPVDTSNDGQTDLICFNSGIKENIKVLRDSAYFGRKVVIEGELDRDTLNHVISRSFTIVTVK